MKITFISDTHSKHEEIKLAGGDVLVHCGDISKNGSLDDIKSFAEYIHKQNFHYKIAIAGNHDFCFEDERKTHAEQVLKSHEIIYLNDSGVNIEGLKFWGSPVQPEFFNWAFNRKRGAEIQRHWDLIPKDTDILITHGPPYGQLDECADGRRVGCEDLLKSVQSLKLKIHAFGHIHEAYGMRVCAGVTYVNACLLDRAYKVRNEPIIVEL